MQLKNILPLALAGAGAAQSQTPDLAGALASQNSSLSLLSGLLQSQPQLVTALSSANNITILAPNNNAIQQFLNMSGGNSSMASPGMIAALLQYHVLNGTYFGSNVTNTSAFIPTLLTNNTYSNVTGGQRVEARLDQGNVTFFTGLKNNASVVTPNLNFTGGTIHIINRLLTLPRSINDTFNAANLTAAQGAVGQIPGLSQNLTQARDLTIFAPDNNAFNAIGNLTSSLNATALAGILNYHVISGDVLYSSRLMNGSVITAGGQNVTIRMINGTVYVNQARVIRPDLLTSNGVLHVIDGVLNPANTTASPNTTASTQAPAFTNAGPGSAGVPFTSGVPTPTTTGPANSGTRAPTTTPTNVGVPMKTGAVGAAALFGAGAVFMNL